VRAEALVAVSRLLPPVLAVAVAVAAWVLWVVVVAWVTLWVETAAHIPLCPRPVVVVVPMQPHHSPHVMKLGVNGLCLGMVVSSVAAAAVPMGGLEVTLLTSAAPLEMRVVPEAVSLSFWPRPLMALWAHESSLTENLVAMVAMAKRLPQVLVVVVLVQAMVASVLVVDAFCSCHLSGEPVYRRSMPTLMAASEAVAALVVPEVAWMNLRYREGRLAWMAPMLLNHVLVLAVAESMETPDPMVK
jgi:hypothetical protein